MSRPQRASRTTGRPLSRRGVRCCGRNRTHRRGTEADRRIPTAPNSRCRKHCNRFCEHLEPGNDAFQTERQAKEIEARLRELQNSLRASPARARERDRVASRCRAFAAAACSRLTRHLRTSTFKKCREARDPKGEAACGPLARRRIASVASCSGWSRACARLRSLNSCITSIAADDKSPLVRTTIRYDIVGAGTQAWRIRARRRLANELATGRFGVAGRRMDGRFAAHEPSQCSDLQ